MEFLHPFLALRNNPKETGSKNKSKNTSNLKLNANVENPIKNSDVFTSITLP